MPDLDEAWLESKNIRIIQGEALRRALPLYFPILSCAPAVPVDEERKIRIIEQELAIQPLNMYGLDVFLASDKVQRRVGLVEQGLSFSCFKGDDFEATGTTDTEGG